MVLDPIPQSLPVHFFGSRPQPPTSPPDSARQLPSTQHLVLQCNRGLSHLHQSCVDVFVIEPWSCRRERERERACCQKHLAIERVHIEYGLSQLQSVRIERLYCQKIESDREPLLPKEPLIDLFSQNIELCSKRVSHRYMLPKNKTLFPQNRALFPQNRALFPQNTALFPHNRALFQESLL